MKPPCGYEAILELPPDDLFERWLVRPQTASGSLLLLRCLRPDLAEQPALRERLRRDLVEVARETPPGFVGPVYLLEEGGRLYALEPLVLGDRLSRLLATGRPVPAPVALRILAQVGAHLHAMQQLGDESEPVVHGTVSPSTLLVQFDGTPWISGWGLTRTVDWVAEQAPTVLAQRAAYIAPELWNGGPVDARADVFSLGAVAYELLTGRRAFVGAEVAHIRAAIEEDRAPRPVELDPKIPVELDTLLRACVARDPDTRPRSCALLAEAFERMLEHGRPVDDADVARWYEEVLPARRDTFRRWADGAPPALAELRQLLGPVPFETAPQSLIPTTHDELARERSHLFDLSHAAGPAVGGASGEPIPGHTTVEAAGGTKTEGPLELAWRSEEGRDRHLTGEDLLIRERAHHDVADERLPRLSGAAPAADVSAPVDAGPPPRRPQSRWVVALALAAALLLVGALALALAVRPLHEGREAPPRTGEHASVPVSPSPAAPDRKAAAASALRQGPVLFVIESSPPGAEIRLAGRRVGTTPWVGQAEVPSPFELELRLDGWRPWHRRLERPATRELKIAARLTPKRQ